MLELSAKRPYSKPALTSGKVALGVFGDYSQSRKDPRLCSLPTLINVELSKGIDL